MPSAPIVSGARNSWTPEASSPRIPNTAPSSMIRSVSRKRSRNSTLSKLRAASIIAASIKRAAEAQSAVVGTVAREFAAVVEVGTKSAHPLEADAARALEHFEHAHSPEHFGAAAEHDMRREAVGREGVLVDQQNAALVAREQNRGSTARDACADNYRVKSFRLPGHERCTTSITLPGKERAPSFEGALPCCEAFQPRLIPAAILAALASPGVLARR